MNATDKQLRIAVQMQLKVALSKVLEVREWAFVIWAKVEIAGKVVCRFVSKAKLTTLTTKKTEVVETRYQVKLNGGRFREALKHVKSFSTSRYDAASKTWSVTGICFESDLMTEEKSFDLEFEMYDRRGVFFG